MRIKPPTSVGRNSTRHPMSVPGGGGLNLSVCQLVDWMFYIKPVYCHVTGSVHISLTKSLKNLNSDIQIS